MKHKILYYISALLFTVMLIGCDSNSGNDIEADLNLSETELSFSNTELGTREVTIDSNVDWVVTLSNTKSLPNWISVSQYAGIAGTHKLEIGVNEFNIEDGERTAVIQVKANEVVKTITVKQQAVAANNFYNDKEIVKLQSATKGNGVDLLFLGDGFTKKDLVKGGQGKYEKAMKEAAEHFFSIQPYKMYREYFNVYMIAAESNEEGVMGDILGMVDNKFKSRFTEGGNESSVTADRSVVREYIALLTERGSNPAKDLTTTLVLNSTQYDGVCYFYDDGLSIALCTMSTNAAPYDFRGLVHHESGGHGFAKLADEYVNAENIGKTISGPDRDGLANTVGGRWQNMDLTNDLSLIKWKDFIGLPQYSDVGAYEGGYYYEFGTWRPEQTSCMVNNIPYYNAPSRWAAVKRIMSIAGVTFTFDDFLNTDKVDNETKADPILKSGVISIPPRYTSPPIYMGKSIFDN